MNSKEQERFVIWMSDTDKDLVKKFSGTLEEAHGDASRAIDELWESKAGGTPVTIDYTVVKHDMDIGDGITKFEDLTVDQQDVLYNSNVIDHRTVFAPTQEPKCSEDKSHDYHRIVAQYSTGGIIDVQVCKTCGLIRFIDTYSSKRDIDNLEGFCTEYNVAAYRP